MKWVLQDQNFGLGNFVNITPVIIWLHQQTAEPVPVYFETEYVRQAYEHSHLIEVLKDKPLHAPFATSAMICRDNSTQDFRFAFQRYTGKKWNEGYKPFVGHQRTAVIINGSGSENARYIDGKNPGWEIYALAISMLRERGFRIVFTGSAADYYRNTDIARLCDWHEVGDMERAIEVVRTADLIIANDTGLAHVAGCFDKHMIVLWKDTPAVRAQNSGIRTIYSHDWENDLKAILQ